MSMETVAVIVQIVGVSLMAAFTFRGLKAHVAEFEELKRRDEERGGR